MRDLGCAQGPQAAFYINLGLETLPIRMDRYCENALKVAKFLKTRDEIEEVRYPGLEDSPNYALAQKYLKKGDSVADIGTGSGILAICAMKFGAKSAYGCDNDETVIDVAEENAQKNGVECVFELNTADKLTAKFDFVLANILHNVLADIMPDLKNILKINGLLVLSGILDEKKQVVIDAVKNCDLNIVEEAHLNQWTSFVVRREK